MLMRNYHRFFYFPVKKLIVMTNLVENSDAEFGHDLAEIERTERVARAMLIHGDALGVETGAP
jgi:hypothetical protein